jgi:hypothetical protein
VAVSVLCNTTLEFCRLLHPNLDNFEKKERIKALCLYSVALSRLGRFYEAHRRLNEADALLSKYKSSDNDVLLGILKLRRAEAHLSESIFVKWYITKSEKLETLNENHVSQRYFGQEFENDKHFEKGMRIALAKLDDAWCTLENAEKLLAGQTHSPLWWARLCSLKLQCLKEYFECQDRTRFKTNSKISSDTRWRFNTLARRVNSHPMHQVYDIFRRGLASCHGNHQLRLRLVDLAMRVTVSIEATGVHDDFTREEISRLIKEVLPPLKRPLKPKMAKEYEHFLIDGFEEFKNNAPQRASAPA